MNRPRLSIIAAMAKNRVIGINNTLPWRLPEDLKHFKALTIGHHILMGRKTFDSLGKPLPGRTSVVITRSRSLQVPGCIVVNSIKEAIAACNQDDEIFIIGGAELYLQALDVADRIYLTEIQAEAEGDAWFPEFDRELWHESERSPCKSGSGLGYDFVIYDKKR
ncbi:MAG: dihydrofolate reductase [Sulfuricella sp.]|nr:dihydrofolate reductase [Sulfuricella sp.]